MNEKESVKRAALSTNTIALLKQILEYISKRRQYQFLLLLGLTIISSFAEIMSLGAVVPFIAILTQPEKVFTLPIIGDVIQMLGILSADKLILPFVVVFAIAAVMAGSLRLLLLWVSIRLIKAVGADLSIEVYRRTLYQPYGVQVNQSSNDIISGVLQKVNSATSVLMSVVTLLTSAMLFVAILTTLILIDPVVASFAILTFGSSYVFIAWATRSRISNNGKCIAHQQTQVVKCLQEGLGAIRDIILDSSQAVYCAVFHKSIVQLQRADSENSFINQAPRYIMEAVGLVLVSALAYFLYYQTENVAASLPVLGALALGAQRILPLLQQFYGGWANIRGGKAALIDVLKLLNKPIPKYINHVVATPFEFSDSISLENLSFRYSQENPLVVDDINLTIKKGSRIGFIGSTGSGKSTTLDLIMLLLQPSHGKIMVDGNPIINDMVHAWQRTIAHVPQSIFLADCTIAENIAIGVQPDKIDWDQVRLAAEQSQISGYVESLPEKYNTKVGERGIRLSGGQRQRIGIARALYKNAKVIVFDEATSALDSGTEKAVMNAIENLNRDITILIIAHRLTTLQQCDFIVKMEHGKIVDQGDYEYFNKQSYDVMLAR